MALRVSRILHAGYVLECERTSIAFDPIFENPFSRNCYAFPSVRFDHHKIRARKFNAVFLSHYHDDHVSLKSLDLLSREIPIYLYCVHEELFAMIRELGFKQVESLQTDVPVTIGTFKVTPRLALDPEIDSVFQIEAAGLNVLNVVDAWIDPSALRLFKELAPWDMVLWPFQTLRELEVLSPMRAKPAPKHLPEEWIEQLALLRPRYVVPSSCQFIHEPWSWYNWALFPVTYKQFRGEVEAALPSTQVVRLNPSQAVMLTENSCEVTDSLSWVLPEGPQDGDFDYQEGRTPPSTAEIARQFAPLSPQQTEFVLQYCRVGLFEKLGEQPQRWKLTVYDHLGCPFPTPIASEEPEWTTEVPIATLYRALVDGEALTSMYIRINPGELVDADILQDPLIRALFTGDFLAYQRAQLASLKAAKMEMTQIDF